MNEENKTVVQKKEKNGIDIGKLLADIRKHKKLYYKVLSITFVASAILMLSIPNVYRCDVMLAPELSRASSNSLLSLANSFGMRLGTGTTGGEALFPTLYPDLVSSVDFKVSLFDVPVTIEGDEEEGTPDRTMSYYDYMKNEQKRTWWSVAIGSTIKWVFSLFFEFQPQDSTVNPFRLTKEQMNIIEMINKRVVCEVDEKTLVITISVTDQNPLICATMADTVKTRLQNFITDYRTSKARVDLEYNQMLYKEAKGRYDKARRMYADFVDHNQDILLESVRQRQTELENEMQLQYNAYQQVAAQLLAAEAKVQQETPAFTTLQSATVPVVKAGPKRAQMCLIFLFLAFLGTTAYILYKENDLKQLLGLS